MAATRLIPLHVNKGSSLAKSLLARTDYAKNPEKTEKGELVTGFECDPFTVDEEFMIQKRAYYRNTGRSGNAGFAGAPAGALRRRKPTVWAMSWRCVLPKGNTPLLWPPIRTGLISITTSFSIPSAWTEQKSSETSGYQASPFSGSATWSVWKTGCP